MSDKDQSYEEMKNRFGEELRKRMSSAKSEEEILAEILQQTAGLPPSRLELVYNQNNNTLLLQGNRAGFEYLRDRFADLAQEVSGTSLEFDEHTSLTQTNLRQLMIRRVDDDDYPLEVG